MTLGTFLKLRIFLGSLTPFHFAEAHLVAGVGQVFNDGLKAGQCESLYEV